MRTLLASAGLAAGLALLAGCSGSAPTSTSSTPLPASNTQSNGYPVLANGDLAQSVAGRWQLAIDPATLQGTATLRDERAVLANDDVYDLSIANFVRKDSLRITSISRNGATLDIDYVVTHPFAAPSNLAGPATAANRADLGVAGRVAFLLDVPSASGNTYFTTAASTAIGVSNVVAETATVANADGYVLPAGLLPGLTTTANAFPYRVLVDESGNGARVGISNGGVPTGNYDAPNGGWQQSNIGATNDGWTGYGVLHQGQAAASTLSLNVAALSGPVNFDAVILAKYNDPRVGANAATKRANRLPKSPVNIDAFAYRMPHGALDAERITFLGESGGSFIPNTISAANLNFSVIDWDARATETSEIDLAADPTLTNVAAGESGAPLLAVDIPAITTGSPVEFDNGTDLLDDDTAYGGDAGQDSGLPGDALYYTRSLTNSVSSGQSAGPVTGMVLAIDPEFGDVTDWHFALDPDLGLANPTPYPVTLQAFQITLGTPAGSPTATFALASASVLSGGGITVQATGYSDPDSDPIEVLIDWNNDNDFGDTGETGNMLPGIGGPQVNFPSPITYTWSGSNPDNRQVRVHYTDNITPVVTHPNLNFTVIENTSMCGAPWTNPTTFATAWSSLAADYASVSFTDSPSNQVEYDYAAFRAPTFNFPSANTNSGWATQRITSTPTYQIHRLYAQGAALTDGFANIPLTNAPATFGNSLATARQVHQIEVDSTNRVFVARRDVGLVSTGLIGPTNGATLNGFYLTASPGFVWFDTDGGATLATDANMNTVATANRVVALAIGMNDDLYLIDSLNILRRFPRAGGYVEDTTAPFPINLTAAPYNIAIGTKYVHDFVQSRYNGAFFIVTEDSGGIDQLYRVECDGSLPNPVTGTTNPNPLTLQMCDWTSLTRPIDIVLDEVNSAGNLIGAAGDAQIVLSGYMTGSHGHDVQVVTTRLEKTGGGNNGVIYLAGVDTQHNWLVTRVGSGTRSFRISGLPPAGWQ